MGPLLYRVDPTPLVALEGRWPMTQGVACPPEPGRRILGAAMEVTSRKGGTMAWGHGSLRIVSCTDGALSDVEYETYRLGAWNEGLLRREHAGAPWAEGPYLETQRGSLVLFRNVHPVDAGWFGQLAEANRDVWELWLDLPPERLLQLADAADAWYAEQRDTFAAGGDLPERYVPWKRNCTEVWRVLLPELEPGSALPFAWLRATEAQAALRVVHPSLDLAAWLAPEWPDAIPRRRPVLRSKPPFERDGMPTVPLGPWSPAPE